LQKTIDGGKNIQVQCPFHGNGQERHPSAGIHKETGVFHCFACGASHTLPEVISYCFDKNDMFGKWGMQWIIKNFNSMQVEERKDVEIDFERNITSNKDSVLSNNISSKPNSFVTEEELDKYRYYHPYWTERGITDEDIIELFDLGYDIDTDCITFPNRDRNGNCVFVARRSVKTKYFNYPKDVEKPLYGLYEINKYFDSYSPFHSNSLALDFDFNINSNRPIGVNFTQDLYITESMIDCLLLWQAGKYAVALNGTGSESQIRILNSLPVRHYVLATDNDRAGLRARGVLSKALSRKLITEVNFPPEIKDIGDLGKAGRFDDIKHIERWEVF
jgi:DNA primase